MKNQKKYYYTPLSFGIRADGIDPEARSRYDRALRAARKKTNSVFVLAGGWTELAQRHGFPSLAHAGETYLKTEGKWDGLILTRIFQEQRSNSVDEMLSLWIETTLCTIKGEENPKIRPVTSWWHAPRVWLICLFIFHKPVRVHLARSTLSRRIIVREILRHECPGYFKSCVQAWWKRRVACRPVKA